MPIQMSRSDDKGGTFINAYGDGGFRIAGQRHEGSVLILNGIVQSWPVGGVSSITLASLEDVIAAAAGLELLLIGTGSSFALPPTAARDALQQAGLAVDSMDTGAAARTYNVLMLEGRRVAAALIAVE